MLERFRSFFRARTHRHEFEDGMTEELSFHIEQYTEELIQSGLSPAEAARRARIEFGGRNSIEGDCREARGLQMFDELGRQLRYAYRMLRKTPGFTITALLTLAVCLGANLTIFAVINSILLRPLPFPDSDRLMTIFRSQDARIHDNRASNACRLPGRQSDALCRDQFDSAASAAVSGFRPADDHLPIARRKDSR